MLAMSMFGMEVHIEPMYMLLAYGGMLIYQLARIEKARQRTDFSFRYWINDNILTTVTSFILIPILLIVCTDTSLKEILPINKVTAFLAGYQTKEILNTLLKVTGMKSVA